MRVQSHCGGFSRADLLVLLVVLAAGLLFFIVSTNPRSGSRKAAFIVCQNQQNRVALAMLLWVEEHGAGADLGFPFQESATNGGSRELTEKGKLVPTIWSISNYLSSPSYVTCPSDKKRRPAAKDFRSLTDRKISYLFCLEADFRRPETILIADRHIGTNNTPLPRGKAILSEAASAHWTAELHQESGGNVAMADGSVSGVTSDGLREKLSGAGFDRQTLLVP